MKHSSVILTIILLIIVTAITIQARDMKQVKVFIDDKSTLPTLQKMALDIVENGDNFITILTTSAELLELQNAGFRTETVYEDAVAHYQTQIYANAVDKSPGALQTMGAYKTLAEINAAIDTLIANNPTIISNKVSIGTTLEGRDIWAFKISDNPNVQEAEPEILYYSATHAREVITPLVLLNFIEHIASNYGFDSEITDIVDNRQMWFILNVNPDGYYHNQVIEPSGGGLWRKNRRVNGDGTFGVDLNRNYGYKWGLDDNGSSPVTSSETYRGTAPFSEPETQTMRDFIEAHEFVLCVDYHSYSNLFLWPWGYDYLYTEDEDVFALMGDSVSAYNNYATGPGWSLYLVNGEAGDWMYGEQTTKNKNLHVLFEVGSSSDGFWPPPENINSLVNENLAPNIFLAKVAGDIYQRVPPKKPIVVVDNLVDSISYEVNFLTNDTNNPAVEYELTEQQGYTTGFDAGDDFSNWGNSGFLISSSDYNNPPSAFYSDSGNNLNTSMTSTEPFLVNLNDTISFYVKYDIEQDWDYAYVEVSTDGINYTSIEGNITTTTNPNGNNAGHGITGSSSGAWILSTFDISSFNGQSIFIRLSYRTDGFVVGDGFRVDDFYPVVSFTTTTVISSTIVDTFYNFTNKPLGSYYYKVRVKDAENQWSNFSQNKKTTVVPSLTSCFANGDINNDGLNLTVADMTYLVRYLEGVVSAPEFPSYADLNGDCIISPDDTLKYQEYFAIGMSAFPVFPVPTCCDPDIDRDGDGIFDTLEVTIGTNPLLVDSDGDSIDDLAEIGGDLLNPLDTDNDFIIDALDPDDDGDGILTIDELSNGDTDLDGIPNYLDEDDDGDGILTLVDNCPLVVNPSQIDSDSDGFGDACDGCCIADRGNVDGGPDDGTFTGSVDIADLVYLVAYSFTGGTAPPCIEEADIDASGGAIPVDISDIVVLVDFMFTGGAAPAPCF